MFAKLRFQTLLRTQYLRKIFCTRNVRNIYNGKHVIYPSSEWFSGYYDNQCHYQELINPMMSAETLTDEEVRNVKIMLDDQADILRQHGNVHLLNPLVQTLDQFLFGVSDILDKSNVKNVLKNLGLLMEDGTLSKSYEKGCLSPKEENFYQLRNCTKYVNVVDSVLNGIASRAIDTFYFGNIWLYLGISNNLLSRPIVVLQSPKYHTRHIERYYGIIACMALGVTPVQIGNDSQGRPFYFEGMADVLPIKDKHGNPLLICQHSSRTHVESYCKLRCIHQHLGIQEQCPELFFIAELKDKFKQLLYHLDLGMHVDENDNLYLGNNILEAKYEEALINIIGRDRVILIPEEEINLYGLNAILYDGRFGSSDRVAIMNDECPVFKSELSKNGYKTYQMKEEFPHGGGSARCRFATFEVGKPHSLETFLDEQMYIERVLGPSHAVITSNQVGVFKAIYNTSHVQEIINNNHQFTRRDFNTFRNEWDFAHNSSSPKCPESNGFVESHIQTVNRLEKGTEENKRTQQRAILSSIGTK